MTHTRLSTRKINFKKREKAHHKNIEFKRRLTNYYHYFSLTVKLLLIILALLFIFTSYLDTTKSKINSYIRQFLVQHDFVINKVIIEGNNNVNLEEIKEAIFYNHYDPNRNSIFDINIDQLRQNILKILWIRDVLIEREIPNTLHISILEYVPIAVWQINNEFFLIDKNGHKITNKNIEQFHHLIHITGIGADLYINNLIENLKIHPEILAHITNCVRVGNRRWDLYLKQNIIAKMPENNFLTAYNYLNELHQAHKLFDQNYQILDMRNKDKYFLKYHDNNMR